MHRQAHNACDEKEQCPGIEAVGVPSRDNTGRAGIENERGEYECPEMRRPTPRPAYALQEKQGAQHDDHVDRAQNAPCNRIIVSEMNDYCSEDCRQRAEERHWRGPDAGELFHQRQLRVMQPGQAIGLVPDISNHQLDTQQYPYRTEQQLRARFQPS